MSVSDRKSAVGFRIKSGRAVAVLLEGPAESPMVLDRRVIDLCDPAIPESIQPYHAVMKLAADDDGKLGRRLLKVVETATRASVSELLTNYRSTGHSVDTAGAVVGSDIDPGTIKNEHIRAHALEGRLFRTAVEQALQSNGMRCLILVERGAYAKGSEVLRRSEPELRRDVANLRRPAGPWRADEKNAALAAWVALSGKTVNGG